MAFAEQIGRPVGGCVASGVRAGMSGAEIHDVARNCAKSARGIRLSLGKVAPQRRARATAEEYYEIGP